MITGTISIVTDNDGEISIEFQNDVYTSVCSFQINNQIDSQLVEQERKKNIHRVICT